MKKTITIAVITVLVMAVNVSAQTDVKLTINHHTWINGGFCLQQ